MTRSTARLSCSAICSSDSSGTAASPRRSCASNRCAFSIAVSPPLAATYISCLFVHDTDRPRQRRDLVLACEQKIDPAREQGPVGGKPRRHVLGQGRGLQ